MKASASQRWWRIGLLVAVIILILAAALFWTLLRPTPGRDPVEFLPASTHAVVGCDVRPGSEGMRQALKEWGASDVKRLGARGTELAQGVVDWLGYALEVKQDVLPWFGGELLIVSVTGGEQRERPLTPDSVVLILRTKSMRKARAALHRGVKPFAREANWHLEGVEHAGTKIAVWADMSGRARQAYAVKDGCVLIANKPQAIGYCLAAAQKPAERLTYDEGFQATVGTKPRESVAWAYFATGSLTQVGRAVLPGITGGWPGLLSSYRNYASLAKREQQTATGALGLSLSPVREGAKVRAVYRAAGGKKVKTEASLLGRVASFAPEEAALSLAMHAPGAWLEAAAQQQRGAMAALLSHSPASWLGLEKLPRDLLITVLTKPQGHQPSLALAAPEGELPVPPRGLLSRFFPKPATAVVDKVAVLATDEQTLKLCLAAAKQSAPPTDWEQLRFMAAVRPGKIAPELDYVRGLKIIGRATPGGGEGEIALSLPPRYLLGFDSATPRLHDSSQK